MRVIFLFVASAIRRARQVNVIWIEAKFVSKSGAEDKVGAVSLKKAANRVGIVEDERTLEVLLAGMRQS